MQRSARSIALCLVLQAHASWGQPTGDRVDGSHQGAATPTIPPTTPLPPAPRVRVTDYRRPSPRNLPLPQASRTRPVDRDELRVAHPQRDYSVRYGPNATTAGLISGAAFLAVGAALTLWLTRDGAAPRRDPSARPPMPSRAPVPMHHAGVEVRRVSVAFDWTARASIQHALAEVSGAVDPNPPPGLHAAAHAARDALAHAHRAARYAVFQTYALDPARGQQVFGQIVDSLRGRSTVEKRATRPEEGPGLVVVTLLVTAKGPLAPLPPAMNLPALMAALEGLIPLRAEQLAALEVIWSPADEGDPMSSAELAALYPELLRLDEGAGLGRRACGSCRAVYDGGLGRCPACGGV